MKIKNFRLERYFAKHEFSAEYLLSCSDCDGYSLKYVLDGASEDELELWEHMTFGYTESEGHTLLRQAILQYYNTDNIDQVVVASPGELNYVTMNVLLEPTDHVVAVGPCYQSLTEIVKSLKCDLSYWKPDPTNWRFDTADLEKAIKKNTKLIVINFPHNPTGSYLDLDQLQEIVRIAREQDLYVFSDEMYHKLTMETTEELPPMSDLYEKGISLWGTSKTFGLAGLRTGWLVSQDLSFLKSVIAFKDYLSICSSAPSEILSIMALNNIDRFLQPNLEKIRSNVSLFSNFTNDYDVIKSFIPPRAGSTSFVELDIEETSLEFSDKMVAQAGIMTVPAEMFEHSGKFIRVGFGRNNFSEVLEVFGRYLDAYDD